MEDKEKCKEDINRRKRRCIVDDEDDDDNGDNNDHDDDVATNDLDDDEVSIVDKPSDDSLPGTSDSLAYTIDVIQKGYNPSGRQQNKRRKKRVGEEEERIERHRGRAWGQSVIPPPGSGQDQLESKYTHP